MATGKGIAVSLPGYSGRCSVAMAHILAALGRAAPAQCSAIVPESLMFSELDARARACLCERYEVQIVRGLRNSTFSGTRANALIVRLTTRGLVGRRRRGAATGDVPQSLSLVRGGLPLHEAETGRGGLRYVHSTELRDISRGMSVRQLRRVRPIPRGIASGHLVLLPRVGLPHVDSVRALRFRESIQLSDCVVALCFRTRAAALVWARAIRSRERQLVALYRGTGARYTTVRRLRSWLSRVERQLEGGD